MNKVNLLVVDPAVVVVLNTTIDRLLEMEVDADNALLWDDPRSCSSLSSFLPSHLME